MRKILSIVKKHITNFFIIIKKGFTRFGKAFKKFFCIISKAFVKLLFTIVKILLPLTFNGKYNKQIREAENAQEITEGMYMHGYKNIDFDTLNNFFESSQKRRISLEQKASYNLISFSIIISIIVTLFTNCKILKSLDVTILIFIGIFYCMVSGFLSFNMIIEKNKVYQLFPKDINQNDTNIKLAFCIELNELMNNKKNNIIATSYRCLLLGLFSFIIAFFIFVY